jgi:hypothetical protein
MRWIDREVIAGRNGEAGNSAKELAIEGIIQH